MITATSLGLLRGFKNVNCKAFTAALNTQSLLDNGLATTPYYSFSRLNDGDLW